jgi:signal transduction histidine kinase
MTKMIRPTDQRLAELREEYKKYVANHHHQWQMDFDFGAGEPSQLQDFWSWIEYKAW